MSRAEYVPLSVRVDPCSRSAGLLFPPGHSISFTARNTHGAYEMVPFLAIMVALVVLRVTAGTPLSSSGECAPMLAYRFGGPLRSSRRRPKLVARLRAVDIGCRPLQLKTSTYWRVTFFSGDSQSSRHTGYGFVESRQTCTLNVSSKGFNGHGNLHCQRSSASKDQTSEMSGQSGIEYCFAPERLQHACIKLTLLI